MTHSFIHSLPGHSRVCLNEKELESVSRENVFSLHSREQGQLWQAETRHPLTCSSQLRYSVC